MKVAFSLVALALVAGLSCTFVDTAKAEGLLAAERPYGGCAGSPCGAVLVPAPNPIPLRRLRVVPSPAPCGPGCGNAVNAYAAPPPCGQAGCGGTAFIYYPKRVYAYWKQPGYTACFPGPAIATGAETAGTIPSAAASAIRRFPRR